MWPSKSKKMDRMEFLLTLRRRGITDAAVLRAMDEVPREMFVSEDTKAQAYQDHALPIDCGQTISQPYMVALMTEALQLEGTEKVLEIGTGSGYQTAVLSRLAREVVSIERHAELSRQAEKVLNQLGCSNVHLLVGDGTQGAPDHAPFDRIIVTAAAERIPPALLEQLADGGLMVLPLGADDHQLLQVLKKRGDQLDREVLTACRFVPLIEEGQQD